MGEIIAFDSGAGLRRPHDRSGLGLEESWRQDGVSGAAAAVNDYEDAKQGHRIVLACGTEITFLHYDLR